MYRNILLPVALDHGSHPDRVLAVASQLAAEGAEITALSVAETPPVYVAASLPKDFMQHAHERIEAELREAIGDRAKIVVLDGHASEKILEYLDEHKCDCVVIEARRSGLKGFMLGSIAHRIARRAPCAVHICR